MTMTEMKSELEAIVADLGRETRVVMLELAEARLTGDKAGADALRAELADLFAERDRKAHALTVLNNHMTKEGK